MNKKETREEDIKKKKQLSSFFSVPLLIFNDFL